MTIVRNKPGPVLELVETVLLILTFVAWFSTRIYFRGGVLSGTMMNVMLGLLGLLGLFGTYGLISVCRSYRFDEERVSSHLFGRVRSLRWSDVTEFNIRRFSGDSTLRLLGPAGFHLDIDFRLLGTAGGELFSVMTRQLQPLIDAKLEKLGREGGRFANRWLGFFPLPGSVTLSDGILGKVGEAVPVDQIREIRVRPMKEVGGGQEYEIVGNSSSLRLRSHLDDVPLLLLYLGRMVPEEQWVTHRPGGMLHKKLLGLVLVVACLPVSCFFLQESVQTLARGRSLPAGSPRTEATVQAVIPAVGRLCEVVYETGEGDDMISGSVTVVRDWEELPEKGSTITIAYDPARPHRAMPVGSLKPYNGIPELILFAVFLVAAGLSVIAMLLRKPAEEPFQSWLHT